MGRSHIRAERPPAVLVATLPFVALVEDEVVRAVGFSTGSALGGLVLPASTRRASCCRPAAAIRSPSGPAPP